MVVGVLGWLPKPCAMHVRPYHHFRITSMAMHSPPRSPKVPMVPGDPVGERGGSDACEYPSKHTRGGPDGLRGGARPAPQPPASNSSASIRGNSWEGTFTARRRLSRSNGWEFRHENYIIQHTRAASRHHKPEHPMILRKYPRDFMGP